MRNHRTTPLLIALCALLLGACETQPRMQLKEDFGNSVQANVAMQVINPDAGTAQPEAATLEGDKARQAMERYHDDKGEADTEKLLQAVTN
ncbi:MAG: hypothetical protein B0D96_12375 [Candidatus Sedimenticola endophacoides]|uniref:Uncharacterized protein n=1 Tax=Candidatus Sedimenticola endophacoides TaxID=2548426 RepID=A0A6N4E9G1_9GAMM|nr:MAG: hypothetical protein B0D94_02690 [Candidatus Sedimenticola endophacoides]OQX33018.1 MAG: hypothetical protein B0D96_12375 [Candidatus Sedimenticola endophacoides]OQX39291.1 MAG: hypothetical protein B0D88_09535 [Candidatus Sedimenticola endophacoides]OQX42561.1 MAG: hypothetical protein B0D89_01005 [Candidatus Sedimenticola endophacoides]PUD97939.1 MAG: hypothetical protein C3L26_14255 [Candidatus Sedimenticola endophacoides]